MYKLKEKLDYGLKIIKYLLKADPHIGLLHRGTEKLIEYKTILQELQYKIKKIKMIRFLIINNYLFIKKRNFLIIKYFLILDNKDNIIKFLI
jgi:hypothetical protein